MASSAPAGTARRYALLSHNINGLGHRGKRRALLARLAALGSDVVALQETHTPDDATATAWLRDGAMAGRPFFSRFVRVILFFVTGGYMGVARCRAPACNLEG